MASQQRSVRVVVRVRPILSSDGEAQQSLLVTDASRQEVIVPGAALEPGQQQGTQQGKRYAFDNVFGPTTPQEELYQRAGIGSLVRFVTQGYHATIFAYGQTGSGKTYTMEGYTYAAPKKVKAGSTSINNTSSSTNSSSSSHPPMADFEATPATRLGIVPRAVQELFACIDADRGTRFSVKCSFIQIYREQAYDLLNAAALAAASAAAGATADGASTVTLSPQPAQKLQGGPGNASLLDGANALCNGAAGRNAQSAASTNRRVLPGGAASAALKLRWSKQQEFYLENLFQVEVGSADEALALFRHGVTNKVMSSHRLNAHSSRSHALFTLRVEASPAASPLEATSATLTLVDLAGSERAAHTGAAQGSVLRDEGISINKSLFTLRQVITALADAAAAGSKVGASNAHVPYRDSKLTSLLKHALGGSSNTLMVACLSPADRFIAENISTLEYAARAKRITNQVAVNEDPKSKLIRELRTEVAMLRQQLAATTDLSGHAFTGHVLSGPGGTAMAAQALIALPNQAAVHDATIAGAPAAVQQGLGMPEQSAAALQQPLQVLSDAEIRRQLAAVSTAAGSCDGIDSGAGNGGAAGANPAAAGSSGGSAAAVEALAERLLLAVKLIGQLQTAYSQLQPAYMAAASQLDTLKAEQDTLLRENARVRDALSMYEGVTAMSPGQAAAAGAGIGAQYTSGTAAYLELEELRRENTLLHERLMHASSPASGPGMMTHGSAGMHNAMHRTVSGSNTMSAQQVQRAASAGPIRSAAAARANERVHTAAAANPFTPSALLAATGGGHTAVRVPQSIGSSSSMQRQTRGHESGPGNAGAHASSAGLLTPRSASSTSSIFGVAAGGFQGPMGQSASTPSQAGSQSAFASGSPAISRPLLGGTMSVHELRNMLHSSSGRDVDGSSNALGASSPGRPGSSSGGLGGSTAQQGLSGLHHAVTAKAVGSNLRLSSTGRLLPTTPARVALAAASGSSIMPGTSGGIASGNSFSLSQSQQMGSISSNAAAGGQGSGVTLGSMGQTLGSRGSLASEDGGSSMLSASRPSTDSAAEGMTEHLSQLLAARNALARQQLG